MQWLADALDEIRHNDIDSDLHTITAVNHQGKTTKGEYRQMDMTKHFGVHDGDEGELPLTADEEKKVCRDIYIANRLSIVSQTKLIEDIEAGRRESIPGTIGDIEWLRQSTARAHQLVAELAPLFADDPTIEQDIVETKHFFDNLAMALGKKKTPVSKLPGKGRKRT